MQRRVRTYGRRSTRVVYIDNAFPSFQSSSLTAALTPTDNMPSSSHSHKPEPAKSPTSVISGLRKSSKARVVLSDSDSGSDLSINRQPLVQLPSNLRRPQGTSRSPETTKPSNQEPARRSARVVQISSSSEASNDEEPTQRNSMKRISTAPSRLGTRSTGTPALRSYRPTKVAQTRRTTLATYELSSDEDAQTTSATQAPTTSDSETEESDSDALPPPPKRGVPSRSSVHTKRTTTRTIVLSSSEEDWQAVTSSSDEQTLPILTALNNGKVRVATPHVKAAHLRAAQRVRRATPVTRQGTPILRPRRDSLSLSVSSVSTLDFDLATPASIKAPQFFPPSVSPPATASSALRGQSGKAKPTPPSALQSLLAEAGQTAPLDFTTFINSFPRDEMHENKGNQLKYRKIGDASYSEVFGIGKVALKVMPLKSEVTPFIVDEDIEKPFESTPEDVLKEVTITKAMGNVCSRFIKLLSICIVKGSYPKELLRVWDEFEHSREDCDGVRPSSLPATQLYCVVILPHAGIDLESYRFQGKMVWREACQVFWQVAKALKVAEDVASFEHRDLHWGQIILRKDVLTTAKANARVTEPSIKATIIDLGLSRMEVSGVVHYSSFDEEVFNGVGILSPGDAKANHNDKITPDYQFDVYRMIRAHNQNDWEMFNPLTNVIWLHYLAKKLLHCKRLRKPAVKRNVEPPPAPSPELEAWQSLVTLEALLAQAIASLTDAVTAAPKKARRKGRGSTAAGGGPNTSVPLFSCAGSVVDEGLKRGWCTA